MDIGKIKVDSARIESGVWIGDIPSMGDLQLKVRGFSSPSYRSALQKAQRGIERGELNRDGSMPTAISDRITGQALHEAALLDWKGVEQDGTSVAYDSALALSLLTDPDYRAFREAVAYAANEADSLKKAGETAVLGNSQASSTGISDGGLSPSAS